MKLPSTKNMMGFCVVGLMAVTFLSALYIPMPAANRDLILILAGAISSRFGTVIDYFFGSKVQEHEVPGTASVSIQATTGDLKPDEAAPGQTT